jgi:putative nucleotide binding protein
MERYAWVLDFLPGGRTSERLPAREPVALGVGQDELKLLEIVLRPGATVQPQQRLALLPPEGATSPAPPVDHVRRRVGFPELTTAARAELPHALEEVVRASPERFLRFYNEAPAISRRFHMLELLPGIGKKTMWEVVEERKKKPFESFADLEARTRLKTAVQAVAARIEKELSGEEEKYRLFVPR